MKVELVIAHPKPEVNIGLVLNPTHWSLTSLGMISK